VPMAREFTLYKWSVVMSDLQSQVSLNGRKNPIFGKVPLTG